MIIRKLGPVLSRSNILVWS